MTGSPETGPLTEKRIAERLTTLLARYDLAKARYESAGVAGINEYVAASTDVADATTPDALRVLLARLARAEQRGAEFDVHLDMLLFLERCYVAANFSDEQYPDHVLFHFAMPKGSGVTGSFFGDVREAMAREVR